MFKMDGYKMYNRLFKIGLFSLFLFAFLYCDKKGGTNDGGTIDLNTILTPGGEKLLPAESGPVRTAIEEPSIDLTDFQLQIVGLVDSAFSLKWVEINDLPAIFSDTILMYCVEGWEVFGTWKGILVEDLLAKAKLQPNAEYVLFSTAEGYSTALPITYLIKYKALLAYEVNGSPLKPRDGFPLRLVAFGKFGYKWAKWITKLEVLDQTQIGFWEGYGYSDRADVPIERRRYYEGKGAMPLDY